MWIVRWIFSVLIILVILGFALQNQDQKVTVRIVDWVSPEMPLYMLFYIAFGLGMITWLLVSIFKTLRLQTEIRRLKKDNKSLKEELDRLRNISVEEEVSE